MLYSIKQLPSLPGIYEKVKAWLTDVPWALLATMAIFMIPTTLLGKVKLGGDINTLSPILYFLSAAISFGLSQYILEALFYKSHPMHRFARPAFFLVLMIPVFFVMPKIYSGIIHLKNLPNNEQKMAYEYAKKHPGEAYFPNNPLSSLLAERKLYNFNCGVKDKALAGYAVSEEHIRRYIPNNVKIVAFNKTYMHQYILRYLPEFRKRIDIEDLSEWIVYTREDNSKLRH